MTANVTSIAKVRAAARDRAERARVNNRAATTLLVLVVVLVVIGLGATQSASSTVALDRTEDSLYFFKRQLMGVGLGTLFLLLASRIPYRVYRKVAIPAFVATVGLLVAVLVIGVEEGGARRWLPLPGYTFQPSELAKVSVVFALAYVFEKKHRLLSQFWHFAVPVAAIVGVAAQPTQRIGDADDAQLAPLQARHDIAPARAVGEGAMYEDHGGGFGRRTRAAALGDGRRHCRGAK